MFIYKAHKPIQTIGTSKPDNLSVITSQLKQTNLHFFYVQSIYTAVYLLKQFWLGILHMQAPRMNRRRNLGVATLQKMSVLTSVLVLK